MDFYDFVPAKNFADWDALFEGAGSENRETLLPGELEFSDQVCTFTGPRTNTLVTNVGVDT